MYEREDEREINDDGTAWHEWHCMAQMHISVNVFNQTQCILLTVSHREQTK